MKKILINEASKKKIEQILKESQGKAKERLMTYADIEKAVKIAEARAEWILVKHRKGLTFTYSMNEKMPNAYTYKFDADVLKIEWSNKGWTFVDHKRNSFYPNQTNISGFSWNLTSEEKEVRVNEIKETLYKNFTDL